MARPAFGHRPLPGAAAAASAGAAARRRCTPRAALEIVGRRSAQPATHRRAHPARAAGRGHRRVRLRQVDAGARCAARQPAPPAWRAERRTGDRGRAARGLRRHPQLASRSAACSKWTRRRSARRRAPARPPMSASGTPSARLFADTARGAHARLYAPAASPSTPPAGAAPACEGQGLKKIEMSFLPDVKVVCDVCGGAALRRRDADGALQGQQHRRGAGDERGRGHRVLLAPTRRIHHALRLLQDVGLGYLTLGQQSPTLSGGEAQRIKLVTELAKVRTPLPSPARREAAGGDGKRVPRQPSTSSTSPPSACTWPTWRS